LQASTGYALRYLTNDTENLKNTDVPLYLAPKQEPVAWRYHYSVNDCYTIFQQYPQGLVDAGKIIEPLYT